MCLMAPLQVVSVDGTTCYGRASGGRIDRASMVLEPDLEVGDWVLVNGGTVVRRLDPDQAEEIEPGHRDPLRSGGCRRRPGWRHADGLTVEGHA